MQYLCVRAAVVYTGTTVEVDQGKELVYALVWLGKFPDQEGAVSFEERSLSGREDGRNHRKEQRGCISRVVQ